MSEAQAAELLRKVIEHQRNGLTWAQVAMVTGYGNGKEVKKAAHAAARITQHKLLRTTSLA